MAATVRLNEEDIALLRRLAAGEDRTQAATLRRLMRDEAARRGEPPLGSAEHGERPL